MPRVFVSGHGGMVGSAILRALASSGKEWQVVTKSRTELDLCNQGAVDDFIRKERPEFIVNAAGKVGGIHANNTYPAEFIRENLLINANLIHSAWKHGVVRFLNLGSSCIYPRDAEQPLREECLLSGPLEPTNSAYALAKIAGLEMCRHYRAQYGVLFHSAMPTNLYGPGDNYHPEHSHVLPALIRRFHEAKTQNLPEVVIWGSGEPRREFLHVDDLATALLHLVDLEDPPNLVNVGTGSDLTIRELAEVIAQTVGYSGKISVDPSRPDGTPVKRTDTRLIESTGWQPAIGLPEGIQRTYQDFLSETKLNLLREV